MQGGLADMLNPDKQKERLEAKSSDKPSKRERQRAS
jgi:hypothetical protein